MVTEEQATVESLAEPKTEAPAPKSLRGLAATVVFCLMLLGGFIALGLHKRAQAAKELLKETSASAIQQVSIAHPGIGANVEEVVVPGNMQAFTETPVWARASGYLRKWYVDIGARVQRGQLLAEIEAPEVDHQLQQAREQMDTEQQNLKLAEITAERYQNLLKQDSIAQQDVDTAVQTRAARLATYRSARANVARLEQMVSYEKVYAPFDGVVTARNIDIGALIDAGANAPGKELFRLASTAMLRVYANVPETYSQTAKPGVSASVTLNEFPGRHFPGTVVRNAKAIDVASRTLLVEVDVPNPTGELLPGSYCSIHLKLPAKNPALTVPANALLFRSEGLQVAVVKDNQVVLKAVTLGHDYGDKVEILHGISKSDIVVVNPSDSIADGEHVQITSGRQEGAD